MSGCRPNTLQPRRGRGHGEESTWGGDRDRLDGAGVGVSVVPACSSMTSTGRPATFHVPRSTSSRTVEPACRSPRSRARGPCMLQPSGDSASSCNRRSRLDRRSRGNWSGSGLPEPTTSIECPASRFRPKSLEQASHGLALLELGWSARRIVNAAVMTLSGLRPLSERERVDLEHRADRMEVAS